MMWHDVHDDFDQCCKRQCSYLSLDIVVSGSVTTIHIQISELRQSRKHTGGKARDLIVGEPTITQKKTRSL